MSLLDLVLNKVGRGGLLAEVCVAILVAGCQAAPPAITETLSPPLASAIATTPASATPSLVLSVTPSNTATATLQPSPTPTPLPVYVPIIAQNAGRLAEVKVIEFGLWSQIINLEWAPDGSFLAVSAGNQLILIDPQTWEISAQIDRKASAPGLAISPDSRYVALASRDGTVSLWEVAVGNATQLTPVYQLDAHRKGANRVAFSPDGLLVASGGNDAMARVRRAADGEELAQIIGGSYAVSDLAFSPDGDWLAIVNSNMIRLRKPDSGVMGLTLQATQSLFCLEFSPDGSWLAAGDSANQVLLWELQDEANLRKIGEHTGRTGRAEALVWQVSFSPTGDLLASAGGDGVVRVWEPVAGQSLAELPGHGGAATSVQFSPDGLWLVSGDLDGRLRVWGIKE